MGSTTASPSKRVKSEGGGGSPDKNKSTGSGGAGGGVGERAKNVEEEEVEEVLLDLGNERFTGAVFSRTYTHTNR